MSHLHADKVSVAFAGLRALSEVDLTVSPGQIVGLIGPNGAGKTTLVNVLTGFQTPTEGAVRLDGQPLSNLKPHELRRRGIARTLAHYAASLTPQRASYSWRIIPKIHAARFGAKWWRNFASHVMPMP